MFPCVSVFQGFFRVLRVPKTPRDKILTMLIVMRASAREEDIAAVCARVESLGYRPHVMPGATRTAIGITGNPGAIEPVEFEDLPGVAEAIRVSKPYKLVSREVKADSTVVQIGAARIGGPDLVVIAGPCAVESREQAFESARAVRAAGAHLFRGGAYKPRTSPYAFQGMGVEGLQILAEIREETGMGIVTEAVDEVSLDAVERYADCIQIGARNMQNFSLLKRAGKARIPVLLKRGMSATLEEFLMAAEYILSEGNYQVVMCERGVRTFADHTRNTLDLSVVPFVKTLSHLPIVVDPSHGTGKRDKVIPLARAAVAVGVDGVFVEVHDAPEKALSDGPNALRLSLLRPFWDKLRAIDGIIEKDAPLVHQERTRA